jgi:hypothetical protein
MFPFLEKKVRLPVVQIFTRLPFNKFQEKLDALSSLVHKLNFGANCIAEDKIMEESALGTFLWKGHRPCTKKSPSDDFRSQVVRQASRKNNANIREKQGTSQLVKKNT